MFKYINVHTIKRLVLLLILNGKDFNMNKVTRVFYISAIVAILFIIWGVIPDSVLHQGNLDNVTSVIQGFLVDKFGWFYLISATGFLGFAIYLIFSRYGNIKLGKPGDKPEYSYITWFAMRSEERRVGKEFISMRRDEFLITKDEKERMMT